MSLGRAQRACLLSAAYTVLAIIATYPLVYHFGTHFVGDEGGDAKIYLWSYWWVERAIFQLSASPFQTSEIFHPLGIGLSLHTLGFLQGLFIVPLRAFLGEIAGVNLLLLWTFIASAGFTYALARRVGASEGGAFLAGVVFAFCPYRLSRLAGHYDLLGTEWIPLFVLALLAVMEHERFSLGRIVLAAGAAAACGYTALSYLVFLGLFTLLVLAHQYPRWRELVPRALCLLAILVSLLSPLLLQMWTDLSSWTYPPYPGAEKFAADAAAYFVPGEGQSLMGSLFGRAFDPNVTETTVFAGYLVSAMAVAALVRFLAHRDRRFSLWLLAAGVFFVLSLGSVLSIGGHSTAIPLPFRLVSALPLLDQLRAPSRFSVVVMLSLAVVVALMWTDWTRRLRGTQALVTTALVSGLVLAEYVAWPTPLFEPNFHPVYEQIAPSPRSSAVVEIPGIEQDPADVMFHQRVHGKPVFVGTAARVPVEKSEYYQGLHLVRPLIDLRKGKLELTPDLLNREREHAPHAARFLDVGFLVVHKAYAKRGVIDFVEEVLPVERAFEDDELVLLETRVAELPENPRTIDAAASISRQHFEAGWLAPEREADGSGFRWAHRARSTILFRRPEERASELVVVVAPLEGLKQRVVLRLEGAARTTVVLKEGWQEMRVPLPSVAPEGVERLWLHWSALERASERDPRRLAARVREVRFE
jgi:hypothetical protein